MLINGGVLDSTGVSLNEIAAVGIRELQTKNIWKQTTIIFRLLVDVRL